MQADFDAGLALGVQVQGTPAFFVNDAPIAPDSVEDLYSAIDDALAR